MVATAVIYSHSLFDYKTTTKDFLYAYAKTCRKDEDICMHSGQLEGFSMYRMPRCSLEFNLSMAIYSVLNVLL